MNDINAAANAQTAKVDTMSILATLIQRASPGAFTRREAIEAARKAVR